MLSVQPPRSASGLLLRISIRQLVMSYLDEVNAFAHYLTDTDWEPEELVQATYRNAFERWETLSSESKCRSWLFRIARNQWTDWMRSRKAGPDLELVDPQIASDRPPLVVGRCSFVPTTAQSLADGGSVVRRW